MTAKRAHRIYNPEIECMDRAKLRELQDERLRKVIRHEYKNVESYRLRMDNAGVSPDDISSLDDLKKLPFMSKDDLRDGFPYAMFAVPMESIVRIQASSGTTGKPIVAGYTQADIDMWTELMARTISAAGGSRDDIIQVAYGYGLFTGGLGAHQGASKLGATVLPMSSGNTQRQIMMMRELGATMLCCTPSYAIYLGETIREMGLTPADLKLKSCCFGAEPWTEEMRQHLEQLLDIDACDIYGLVEICGPGVAFECLEKDGMHINEDHVIPEIIDPDTGEQLPIGARGELVFTTITKEGMPMIRYRTHDICKLNDAPCACGRTLIRMERVTGRTDDMIVIRGVNVFPSQFETILVNFEQLSPHYMLVVERVNHVDKLEVQCELTEQADALSDDEKTRLHKKISDQIKSVIGISVKLTMLPPKSIPRSEGKAVRIIDNRKLI